MNDEVSRDDDRDPAEDSARTPRDDEPRGGARKAGLFSRMFGKQPQPSEPEPDSAEPAEAPAQPERPASEPVAAPEGAPAESDGGFWARMKQGMSKTSKNLGKGLADLLVGAKEIDDEIFEEIETQLLVADVGVEATDTIIGNLTDRVGRQELVHADALYEALQEELRNLLVPVDRPLEIDTSKKPYVILMVGVNGVGKTTTIGKLACRFKAEGKNVMLAAGDTFRAAAVEQLQGWGDRNNVPVVSQGSGADSASVAYDAYSRAKARDIDVLIVDTAGRLHTQNHLMDELKKIKRVLGKQDEATPHEIMLVVDATTGGNALQQAVAFNEAVGLTGITVTKLDGSASGGIVFAICQKLRIPLRFIGVGEKTEDLGVFEAEHFLDALFKR